MASVLAANEEPDQDGYLTGNEVGERVRVTTARRATRPDERLLKFLATGRAQQPAVYMTPPRPQGCSVQLHVP